MSRYTRSKFSLPKTTWPNTKIHLANISILGYSGYFYSLSNRDRFSIWRQQCNGAPWAPQPTAKQSPLQCLTAGQVVSASTQVTKIVLRMWITWAKSKWVVKAGGSSRNQWTKICHNKCFYKCILLCKFVVFWWFLLHIPFDRIELYIESDGTGVVELCKTTFHEGGNAVRWW